MSKLIRLLFLSIGILLAIGCINKYKFTMKLCNGKIYAEVFSVNPAGVDEDYLTDSLNFRIFVGKSDSEHERFSYICNGDSIKVLRLAEDTTGPKMNVVDSITLSLSDLTKNKTQSKEPLFKFK